MPAGGPLRIYENLRTVSYAPFYLAEAGGHYAGAGLEVEVLTSPAPAETAAGLLAGRVDVSWGGPMRVLLEHDRDPDCPLVCFCQVVGRDPFVLVGGEPNPAFRFEDLRDRRVGVVSEVPTPWMTLHDDLSRAGVDPQGIDRSTSRTMAGNVDALRDGELDVVQLMEPYVELAVHEGIGHVWHRSAVRGVLAFTTFYATRAFVDARRSTCASLTRALAGAVEALYTLPVGEVAERIAPWFPELDPSRLENAVAGYRASELWTRDPAIRPAHLARLKAALLSGGLISRDVPFEAVVDAGLAGGA